jgi:hypothetical protein
MKKQGILVIHLYCFFFETGKTFPLLNMHSNIAGNNNLAKVWSMIPGHTA